MTDHGARLNLDRDNERDSFCGVDGADHETPSAAIYYGHMHFCGCGDPDSIRPFVAALLTANPARFEPDEPRPADHAMATRLVAENPEAAAWFVLYALDAWEFTEHGGSVNGSWLTERGKQVAETFAAHPIDPDDEQAP